MDPGFTGRASLALLTSHGSCFPDPSPPTAPDDPRKEHQRNGSDSSSGPGRQTHVTDGKTEAQEEETCLGPAELDSVEFCGLHLLFLSKRMLSRLGQALAGRC